MEAGSVYDAYQRKMLGGTGRTGASRHPLGKDYKIDVPYQSSHIANAVSAFALLSGSRIARQGLVLFGVEKALPMRCAS